MHSSSRHAQILQSMEDLAPVVKTWALQWDDLKVMWNAGMPLEEIAENLGRTASAVLTQAARLGLARRVAPGRKSKRSIAAMRQLNPAHASNVIAFHQREEAAIRANTAPRYEKRDRTCLMCSTSFTSHGSHNRICPRCKAGAAYQIAHTDDYQVLSA